MAIFGETLSAHEDSILDCLGPPQQKESEEKDSEKEKKMWGNVESIAGSFAAAWHCIA